MLLQCVVQVQEPSNTDLQNAIVQKVYSRLNLPLPYDPNLRCMRIDNLFRLANYRVRTVGISEIKTTFSSVMEMPEQLAL
ncbi:hypothetical protein PHYSODRAFT_472945 [Phytophthora sojae]|uniref:Uncharacterized protein n=1 Tax=Phytophthora sojae (strain P6497) TaxID=1094619 RepID=G4YPT0_PHYSP|nr:hypothetical protein PHYSODRAFT_472945 [Phytophthora sojae]EGZ28677.1 hypothetical protein PHYSODRAFT_472945 [Phytophthora sojae]|eukprot:XP_009515952.1 hypothetical protein PHYSODRAFT_472945 [Phytophthora sojae]